jgi:hypothetical protein
MRKQQISAKKRIITFAATLSVAVLGPVVASATDVRFASPSGNITCVINDFVAACRIADYTPTYTNRPNSCEGEWGNYFFVVPSGEGKMGCISSEIDEPAATLPYGSSIDYTLLSCSSETTGITCTNTDGNGFSVRSAEQRIF